MERMLYPEPIEKLIEQLKKLPGVGRKTAERYAFDLYNWKSGDILGFCEELGSLHQKMCKCPDCNVICDQNGCTFCKRESQHMCIAASSRDVYAIESTAEYRGLYHVLGTLINPMEGKMPDCIDIEQLKKRIAERNINEIIIAFDASLEADATAHFLKDALGTVAIYRLAFGIPVGSSLEYVDEGTLSRALSGKQKI